MVKTPPKAWPGSRSCPCCILPPLHRTELSYLHLHKGENTKRQCCPEVDWMVLKSQ